MRLTARILTLFLLLAMSGWAAPAPAAPPDGTLAIGVHVTLVSRWLDPGETEALITPFMVLYTLHDALAQAHAGQHQRPEPGRVVDPGQGRRHLRVRAAQERQVPQRRPGHRRRT